MLWDIDASTGTRRARDAASGLTVAVIPLADDWWAWEVSRGGQSWTPDTRWFFARVEAEAAAERWLAEASSQTATHLAA